MSYIILNKSYKKRKFNPYEILFEEKINLTTDYQRFKNYSKNLKIIPKGIQLIISSFLLDFEMIKIFPQVWSEKISDKKSSVICPQKNINEIYIIPKEIQKIISSFLLDCEMAMIFPQFYDRKLKTFAISWCAARNNCLEVLKWTQSEFGNFPHSHQDGNGKIILLTEALKSNNIKILDFIFKHSSIADDIQKITESNVRKEIILRNYLILIMFKDCDINALNFLNSKLVFNKFIDKCFEASILSGSVSKFKWLIEVIEKNGDVQNLKIKNRLSSMMYCGVRSKNIEMVEYLLKEFELPMIAFRYVLFAKALSVSDNIEMLNWLIKNYPLPTIHSSCWGNAVRVSKNIETFKWLISQNCFPTNKSLRIAAKKGCFENFKYLFDNLNLRLGWDNGLIDSAILGRNMKIVNYIMMDESKRSYPSSKCYASALKSDRYILFGKLLLMNIPKTNDAFDDVIKDDICSKMLDAQKIIRNFDKLRAHDFNFSDLTFSHAIAKCIQYPYLESILDWLLKNNCPFTLYSFSPYMVIKTGEEKKEKFYIIDWMIKKNLLLHFPDFDFKNYF